MKKRFMSLGMVVMMALFLCSCTFFQVRGTEQGVVGKIAARHLGFELQKNYPDVAAELLVLSREILVMEDSDITAPIINNIVSVLTNEAVDDPLIAMDVQDLVSLIEIKPDIGITEEQLKVIRSVAQGLTSGIEM